MKASEGLDLEQNIYKIISDHNDLLLSYLKDG